MMSLNALADFLTQTPEGQRRMRDTLQALTAMPKPVRREVRAERDFLQARHPRMDGGALLHLALVRIATGNTRHNETDRRAEAAALIADARGGERIGPDVSGWPEGWNIERALLAEVAKHGPDCWPFRRAMSVAGLSLYERRLRAWLDRMPRGLWDFALVEAQGWPEETWTAWDRQRTRQLETHVWVTEIEAGAVAWAITTGDIRLGLSRDLWALACSRVAAQDTPAECLPVGCS